MVIRTFARRHFQTFKQLSFMAYNTHAINMYSIQYTEETREEILELFADYLNYDEGSGELIYADRIKDSDYFVDMTVDIGDWFVWFDHIFRVVDNYPKLVCNEAYQIRILPHFI